MISTPPMRHLLILSSMLLSLASARLIAQSEPPLIPFQGRLTDQTGQLVSNGVFSVVFQLYTAPVGGDILWSERHERVGVINGMVNVFLGSISPLTSIDFGATRHLGITVDIDQNPNTPDVEMVPRQMIIPAFWAKKADWSANSGKLAGFDWGVLLSQGNNPQIGTISEQRLPGGVTVPIGGVLMWWGSVSSIPPGFELCDGTLPVTNGALLGVRKPDLRDRFVKGATADRLDVVANPVLGGLHQVPERKTGGTVLSVAQMPAHNHTGTTGPANSMNWIARRGGSLDNYGGDWRNSMPALPDGAPASRNDDNFLGQAHTHNFTTSSTGSGQSHDHTVPAHDNRPAFLEMLFIIRVK